MKFLLVETCQLIVLMGEKFMFLYVRRKIEISSVLFSVFFQTTDLQVDIVCYAVLGECTMRMEKKSFQISDLTV